MHRKGAQDAKRAKIFTRLGKELSVAVKQGVDPEANPRLESRLLRVLVRLQTCLKIILKRYLKKLKWAI